MNKWPLILLLACPNLFASESNICSRGQNDIKIQLQDTSSRISFKNGGGLINGGVCWWHSRLQRSSAWLVQFEPERNPPSKPELQKIIHSLRVMNQIVRIPGYRDFETFSRDYKKELQAMLESWQREDGFLNFEWIRGISGKHSLPPGKMQIQMDSVYDFFKKSPAPVWIMAQIKGITSHSFLLLDMIQNEHGYDLYIIDSNHPQETLKIEYYIGDGHLKNDDYTFVPYVGFQNDFKKIFKALSANCQQLREIDFPEGDIESEHFH